MDHGQQKAGHPPGFPANQDDQDPWDDSLHATNAIYQIHHGFTRFAEFNSTAHMFKCHTQYFIYLCNYKYFVQIFRSFLNFKQM